MLSRSTLALSAFALLAAGGVMGGAAAGPDDMNKRGGRDHDSSFNVRVNIGGGSFYRAHREPPRPVFCAEPAPVIAEVAPRTLEIQAYQAGDTVIILARGENTTSGFVTSLEHDNRWGSRYDGTARVVLHNYGPIYTSPRAQVCSPFAVSGGFETREHLTEINVWIAGQQRCIPIQRIEQMPHAR
ncbi:MAG: hypothetical protein Q8L55_13335 [Phycisphaerales bacterium]|nr:hypothetical protein [Phycisphaerales bacterium]